MASKIVIDPAVFVLPFTSGDAKELELGLRALTHWSKLLGTARQFRTPERCVDALYELQLWPTFENLKRLCAEVDIADPYTLHQSLSRIVSNEPYLERDLGIAAILLDEAQTQVLPSVLANRLPEKVRGALFEALGMCAFDASTMGTEYALASVWDSTEPMDELAAFETFIDAVEVYDRESEDVGDGFTLELELLLESYWDTDDSNIAEIWEADPVAAVQLACVESQVRACVPFRIHQAFISSIKALRIHRRPGVLRAIFRKAAWIVSGIAPTSRGAELHWIEEPKDGPQKIRSWDEAKAWRCQVEKYGPGYQLHYWKCPDGTVEFAVVQQHKSVYIPE